MRGLLRASREGEMQMTLTLRFATTGRSLLFLVAAEENRLTDHLAPGTLRLRDHLIPPKTRHVTGVRLRPAR
jgi:hypothetical protein